MITSCSLVLVLRFLQALQVATGAWNVNRLLVVGALTR